LETFSGHEDWVAGVADTGLGGGGVLVLAVLGENMSLEFVLTGSTRMGSTVSSAKQDRKTEVNVKGSLEVPSMR
jgi:hypothetical protein